MADKDITAEFDAEVDADKVIGENIQRYRKAAGMTQAQLAETLTALGGQTIAQQTILKIEKGTRPLRLAEGGLFALALDVPIHALTAGTDVSTWAAKLVAAEDGVTKLQYELTSVGNRLGRALLSLAFQISFGREFHLNSEVVQAMTKTAEARLKWDWGDVLNDRIMQSLREQPYLAQIKPKFRGDGYAEVLEKVAETPVRNWKEGSDDATP